MIRIFINYRWIYINFVRIKLFKYHSQEIKSSTVHLRSTMDIFIYTFYTSKTITEVHVFSLVCGFFFLFLNVKAMNWYKNWNTWLCMYDIFINPSVGFCMYDVIIIVLANMNVYAWCFIIVLACKITLFVCWKSFAFYGNNIQF